MRLRNDTKVSLGVSVSDGVNTLNFSVSPYILSVNTRFFAFAVSDKCYSFIDVTSLENSSIFCTLELIVFSVCSISEILLVPSSS